VQHSEVRTRVAHGVMQLDRNTDEAERDGAFPEGSRHDGRGSASRMPSRSLSKVRTAARSCRNCDLWRHATQTVFGEGPERATLMLVGEQPGNDEDLKGHPFVGPAGKLLDRALEEAGIERAVE